MRRARSILLAACIAACGAACGGEPTRAPPARTGAAAGLDAPRVDGADVIVATVGGHPVWASCLTDQLHRGTPTREAALRECVDVELLARAADRRGLAVDHDVVLATRTALVSRVVELGFEDRIRSAADLPAEITDKAFEARKWRMHRPEVRGSGYLRVVVPDRTPAGAPVELAAHALADRLAAAAAPQTGLFTVDLAELGDRLATGADPALKLEHADVGPMTPEQLDPPYARALYAIPDVGRTDPVAVRTKFGWDIILLTQLLPPLETSRDELLAQMFPDLRRLYFPQWVDGLRRSLGITVEHDDAALPALDQLQTVAGGLP